MTNHIDLDIKINLLRQQACFKNLNDTEIYELSELLILTVFTPGEVIVKEGDHVDSIYLIVSGEAEIRHEFYENGILKYTKITQLSVGEAIGLNEAGFYSLSGFRTATAIALTDVVALQLSVARFHGFALIHPHVLKEMRNYGETITKS